jgi:hypothetical protein
VVDSLQSVANSIATHHIDKTRPRRRARWPRWAPTPASACTAPCWRWRAASGCPKSAPVPGGGGDRGARGRGHAPGHHAAVRKGGRRSRGLARDEDARLLLHAGGGAGPLQARRQAPWKRSCWKTPDAAERVRPFGPDARPPREQGGHGGLQRRSCNAGHRDSATLLDYRRSWFVNDLVAGLVLTAILVPVGMGYAEASGLPAINGLYATILPAGRLRHLRAQPHHGARARTPRWPP